MTVIERLEVIPLTPAEMQSRLDRVRYAEMLVEQLPADHDGRNTWLLNYGVRDEARALRDAKAAAGVTVPEPTQPRKITMADADPDMVQRALSLSASLQELQAKITTLQEKYTKNATEFTKSVAMILAAQEWAPGPTQKNPNGWLDKQDPTRRSYPTIGALWSDLNDEQRDRYIQRSRQFLGLEEKSNG